MDYHTPIQFHVSTLNTNDNRKMPGDVTQLLKAIDSGDETAVDRLLNFVYEELRQLALQKMANESNGMTLQPTALVHETYVRLFEGVAQPSWENRRHFFGAAAETMRRILIDHARRRNRLKRGGDYSRTDLHSLDIQVNPRGDELLALDEALERFTEEDPEKAELVKLRYFAGVTLEDAAEMLQISRATASRYWTYSRAWLFDFLDDGDEKNSSHFS